MERSPSEVAAAVAADAVVLEAAARELRVPLEELSAARLAGDASTRSFVRIVHPTGSAVAVKYPAPFSVDEGSAARLERWCERADDGLLTFANDPLCHLETTALLAGHGLPVPEVVAVADREGIIFVADAGDDLLQTWLRGAPIEDRDAAYARAVDFLAEIRRATADAIESGMVAGRLALDEAKLGWELDFWRINTFDRHYGEPLSREADEAVRSEGRALARAISAAPRVLCHRDYHARNLLVRSQDPADLVVIDFQDARLGPLTYDIVSILEDPYAEIEPDRRNLLLERFLDLARADAAWRGDEAFREQYDLMTVQRLLKAIGTYTNQAAVRGKRDYLPYIAPAALTAERALERLERYPALGAAVDAIVARET